MSKTEKYSPKWLLEKIAESDSDTVKLLYIIEFQNNVDMRSKQEQIELATEAFEAGRIKGFMCSNPDLNDFLKSKGLSEELELGHVYKDKNAPKWLMSFTTDGRVYGFDGCGDWMECELDIDPLVFLNNGSPNEPATDQEWEAALIGEAERLGFIEGTKYKCAMGNNLNNNPDPLSFSRLSLECGYMLTDSNGGCIFYKGIWATIITEPTTDEKIDILWKERNK